MKKRSTNVLNLLVALVLVSFVGSALHAEDKLAEKPASKGVEKITIEQFEEKAKEKDVVILDVRSAEEFKEGHVPGATNVNVSDEKFAEKVEALGKDKSILVYCRSGKRSTAATDRMSKMGFEKLYNFVGSMNEWTAAKKPVEKGDGAKK